MENKEMKKPIPVELEEEELSNVSGGTATAASQETQNQDEVIIIDEDPLCPPLHPEWGKSFSPYALYDQL